MLFPEAILTTAYLPSVEYFFAIAQSGNVLIEQNELYQKQSYRNRCRIFSTGGVEQLIIPVIKEGSHSRPIRDVRIDYSDNWLLRHKRAIDAAYNSSPFYLYYKDDFNGIFDSRPEYLFDLNMKFLELLLELIGLKANIRLTDKFESEYPSGDFRTCIQPKFKGGTLMQEYKKEKTYFQVFSNKLGFQPNLSVIDLLFNEGPDSVSYLL